MSVSAEMNDFIIPRHHKHKELMSVSAEMKKKAPKMRSSNERF